MAILLRKIVGYFFYTTLVLLFLQCKQPQIKSHDSKLINIATKSQTAKLLIKDDHERFFEKIQPIDVAIQLQDNSLLTNLNYVEVYKKHLESQALDFTKSESENVQSIMDEIFASLQLFNPKLKVPVHLSKVDVGHYGLDVFYTRGNAIFIPKNVLEPLDKSNLKRILYHEMWHVLSEVHPDLKTALYATIGFIKNNTDVVYPPALKRKLLTNPDGAHDDYAMELKGRRVLPLLISKHDRYKPEDPLFMNYIQFELFNLKDNGEIEIKNDLTSTVSTEQYSDFFLKIKDNTDYIIHPDEIIADNFILAVTNDDKLLSSDGKKLYMEIQGIIKNWK